MNWERKMVRILSEEWKRVFVCGGGFSVNKSKAWLFEKSGKKQYSDE